MANISFFAGIAVFVVVFVVLWYLYYCGLFHPIVISIGGPFVRNATIVYKFAQGPYAETGRIFQEISSLAPKAKCIGLYYDNPDKVKTERLRWAAGAILSEGTTKLNTELQRKMEEAGFKLFQLPNVSTHVRTTFPFKNMVSLMIAYRRVYPKLVKYIQMHKLDLQCMVEVYADNQIMFMGPQELQDEFFVPEAKAAETDEHRYQ